MNLYQIGLKSAAPQQSLFEAHQLFLRAGWLSRLVDDLMHGHRLAAISSLRGEFANLEPDVASMLVEAMAQRLLWLDIKRIKADANTSSYATHAYDDYRRTVLTMHCASMILAFSIMLAAAEPLPAAEVRPGITANLEARIVALEHRVSQYEAALLALRAK